MSDGQVFFWWIGAGAGLLALESLVIRVFWRCRAEETNSVSANSKEPFTEWKADDTVASLERPFRRSRPGWAKSFVKPIGFLFVTLAVAALAAGFFLVAEGGQEQQFNENMRFAAADSHQGDALKGGVAAGGSFIGMAIPPLLAILGILVGCAGSVIVGIVILAGPPAPARTPKKAVKCFYEGALTGGNSELPCGIWFLTSKARAKFKDESDYYARWKIARGKILKEAPLPAGTDSKIESISIRNMQTLRDSQASIGFKATLIVKTSVVIRWSGNSSIQRYAKVFHEVTGRLIAIGSKWYIEDCGC